MIMSHDSVVDKAQLGGSYLGSLMWFKSDAGWGYIHVKAQLECTPKIPIHIACSVCWLCLGISSGIISQNTYTWPLHVAWGSYSVVAGSERDSSNSKHSKRQEEEAARSVKDYI